jgi:D-alanyl-D-alanine carboxypeptidase
VLGGKTGSQRDAAMRSLLDKHFAAASDIKPTPAQLTASLVGAPPPPLPAVKKPVLALAPAKPAPTPPSSRAEGDISEPARTIKASLPLTEPTLNNTTKSVRYAGAFHVQVGAFMSQADAENRLGMVQQRALDLLDGHLPFTASFMKDDKEWYRARFAGFSKDDAQTTCAALKKLSLECVAMRAE